MLIYLRRAVPYTGKLQSYTTTYSTGYGVERREPMKNNNWREIIKSALSLLGHFFIFISSLL